MYKEFEEVKKETLSFEDGSEAKYELIIEAPYALEPVYYWTINTLKRDFDYSKIIKNEEWISVPVRSPEFEKWQRSLAYSMEEAMKIVGQIHNVVQGLSKTLHDYSRVKELLELADKKKNPDEIALKGLWVDFVDSRSGASIANMIKKYSMYGLRDLFFKVNSVEEVDNLVKKGITNQRIASILKRKIEEYKAWKKNWIIHVKNLAKILEERIKSAKGTINMYKEWVRPFLKAVRRTVTRVEPLQAETLEVGSNIYSVAEILAPKGFDFKNLKSDYGSFVPALGIHFEFIYGPSGQAPYVNTRIVYKPFIFKLDDFLKELDEWEKDIVDEWIEQTALGEKLINEEDVLKWEKEKKKESYVEKWKEKYLKKVKKEEGKEEYVKPFNMRIQDFFYEKFKKSYDYKKAKEDILKEAWSIYELTKKNFGLLFW